jgi:hypothetical protein
LRKARTLEVGVGDFSECISRFLVENRGASVVLFEYNSLFVVNLSINVPKEVDFDRSKKHVSNLYYGGSSRAFINLTELKGFDFIAKKHRKYCFLSKVKCFQI